MIGIAAAESITTRPVRQAIAYLLFNPLSLHRVDACGLTCTGISISRSFASKLSFDDEPRVRRQLDASFELELKENGDAPLGEAEEYYLVPSESQHSRIFT